MMTQNPCPDSFIGLFPAIARGNKLYFHFEEFSFAFTPAWGDELIQLEDGRLFISPGFNRIDEVGNISSESAIATNPPKKFERVWKRFQAIANSKGGN